MPITIAVSGLHGAGTTTVAQGLVEAFNLRYISAGMIFRQLAKEKGITLVELSQLAEKHHSNQTLTFTQPKGMHI